MLLPEPVPMIAMSYVSICRGHHPFPDDAEASVSLCVPR
ncbi:Uncharacterised protein [Mycobacterium tuberculosis]|uniref:Uncharacterized protein n=1 Tax=Mycobacterium tuberculosis TaxID=1773 RepID=A0A916LB08_MYCTX|nr:Uncharacterised protein [Mycobacterium tuberculosis]CPA90537.1 Uncharacterised protein [Mycobacterium tuberculosis]